jgi:hypothetical protein
MTMRKYLVCGAAGFVLAAAAVTPGLAQYSRQSTPAERAETSQLNRDGVSGRVVEPTASAQADYNAARSDYEAAQQRYQQQLDDYNARQRAYEDQRDNFNRRADRYEDRQDAYRDQQGQYIDRNDAYYDNAPVYNDGNRLPYPDDNALPPYPDQSAVTPDNLWTLDHFADPNSELYNSPVVDVDGFTVGHFRRIEPRDSGARVAVITLTSQRTISLPIEEIFYDPAMSVVVARLTTYEIDRTPSGPFAG